MFIFYKFKFLNTYVFMEDLSNYYSAIDLIPSPVVIIDKDTGRVTYLNEPASSLFRINLSEENSGVSELCHYPETLSSEEVLLLFQEILWVNTC